MTKGSQLAQLKSALQQAGVTGQRDGKKRKRAVPQEKDKAKKAARLQEIHEQLNPFDIKVTKTKHDLNGRKLKGVTGKPARSKQAGIEQRKKTLLREFEDKNRAGGIIDRRFGENNPHMSIEERMLERFTRERQRGSKSAAFNLGDDADLTHYGTSLSKLDDFDDIRLPMEDEEEEEEGQIDRDIVRRTHFSGFGDEEESEDEDQGDRKKSKAEVMAEVIAKSKEHKILRQMEREQQDNVRHELDEAFDSMRDLLYASTSHPPLMTGKGNGSSEARSRNQDYTDDVLLGAGTVKDGMDKYDQHVRELAFDKRAKPKDRLKTEEEIALEMKEALERAEKKRRRRMLGEADGVSDDEFPRKKKKSRGGDDLEDDFEESWQGLGLGLGDNQSGDERKSTDARDSDMSQESEDEDEDLSDSDESVQEAGSAPDVADERGSIITEGRITKTRPLSGELPFTFPCPETLDEFLHIVEDVPDSDVPTVIHRIRTLHHPSLSPVNSNKLQSFTAVLVDYFWYAASSHSSHFSVLDSIAPHVRALTRAYPISAAVMFNAKLSLMHDNLKRDSNPGSQRTSSKTWPGLTELGFLRLISELWPTSDMNHAIISPTRTLIGAYLGLCRVRSLSDIASGAFLATLLLEFESLSRRYIPEVLNFLINAVLHLVPHKFTLSTVPGSFPAPDFGTLPDLKLAGREEIKPNPQRVDLAKLLTLEDSSEQAKLDLLSLIFGLLGRFSELYKDAPAFIEIWEPVIFILQGIKLKSFCEEMRLQLRSLRERIERLVKFSHQGRKPLLLQAHKPIPIPSYAPKFDISSSSYLHRLDPDYERNQAAKLRKQYKQERKGAIRELRKDARFLASAEQEKQREKDQAYHDRMKKAFGSIESERAEQKAMERESAREKRRSGRK